MKSLMNNIVKHEFVLSGSKQKEYGVRTLDMAKRLLDFWRTSTNNLLPAKCGRRYDD